jgi:UPF0755 protein
MEEIITTKNKIIRKLSTGRGRFFVATTLLILIYLLSLTTPPNEFSSGIIVTIPEGETIKGVGELLKKNDIIKSASLFTMYIVLSGEHVVEGDYLFSHPRSLFGITSKITHGEYDIPTERVFFFEGMSVTEMATRLKNAFPNFAANEFLELALPLEGYLFPDTYEFKQNTTPEIVIETMRENFDLHIEEISERLSESEYSIEEIVTMASIIEKEATRDTMQEVSNVLWKRINLDIALQVDAPFVYYKDKGSFDLTLDDLREDHPYNTYTNRGLTPTPIGNPGIDSIFAAAFPQETSYLYFLTGHDGNMYFATTFDGHKRNKALYLN